MPARARTTALLVWLVALPAAAAETSFEVTSETADNFRAAVTIANPEDRRIGDWTLDFTLDRSIVQAFGADVKQLAADRWRFTPADWTREIPAKGEIRFTLIGRPGNLKAKPADVKLDIRYAQTEAATAAPAKEAGTAESGPKPPAASPPPRTSGVAHTTGFKVKSAWNTGYTAEMVVINQSNQSLRPWRLELAIDSNIEELWDGNLQRIGAGRYVVTPKEYNQEIPPGGFVTFGFKATPGFARGPTETKLTAGG